MNIDFLNCRPVDVIARSIAMHPTALSEALRSAGDTHRIYSRNSIHPTTRDIAAKCAAQCEEAAEFVDMASAEAIAEDVALMVPALHQAGKLQCLPMSLIVEIAGRA